MTAHTSSWSANKKVLRCLEFLRRTVAALGGRRFLLALGAGGITSALVWYGKIDGVIYRDVILGTVGIYIAGNTYQKATELKK